MREDHAKPGGADLGATERVLAALSALATLGLLAAVWAMSGHGFDYTDEGYYLIWISRPFDYPESATQFGFVYHPLYELLGGDVAHLRRASFLLSFCLAGAAGWSVFRRFASREGLSAVARVATVGALAATALASGVFYGQWMPGPSYNTLTVQGMLVAVTGVLLVDARRSRAGLVGWLLAAVGTWVTFLAKPTSAVALALVLLAYLLVTRRFDFRGAGLAVLGGLATALATALLADGSTTAFLGRLLGGARLAGLLQPGYQPAQLLGLDALGVQRVTDLPVLGMLLMAVPLGWFLSSWHPVRQGGAGAMLTVGLLAAIAWVTWWQLPNVPGPYRNLLVFVPAIGGLLAAAAALHGTARSSGFAHHLAAAVAMGVLPYAYVIGTSNDYWNSMGGAVVFLALAGVPLVLGTAAPALAGSRLLVFALALQGTLGVLIFAAWAKPYRQPAPLWQQTVPVQLGSGTLLLDPRDARFLGDVRDIASRGGFRALTPVLDLTGLSPGVLYALGARSTATAWTLGGYPGAFRLLQRGLGHESCTDLAATWVLTEPGSPNEIRPLVLATYGADLARDFALVGEIESPRGTRIQLHRPAQPPADAQAACERARRSRG